MAELRKRGLSPKVLTEEERAAKEKSDAERFTKVYEAQAKIKYRRMSLWGEQERHLFTFTDWEPTVHTNVQAAKEAGNKAYKIAKDLRESHLFNVFLFGNAGAGKTSLALAIMEAVRDDYSTMFVSVAEWRNLKFKSFKDNAVAERLSYTEKLMREVDVLVLDDFGKETQAEAKETVATMLFELADARRGKSTIITSNDDLAGLAKKYDQALLSRLITKDIAHVISANKLDDVRKV